ncbi:MAG: DNA polymerase IV [Mobilitalea sp.]
MGNLIFHIDVNSAFLSWEAVYRLQILGEKEDLREIPSAVGGDAKKRHGIILAKSPSAKQYGVRTGDSISNALKLCPELVLVPPRHDLYEINSRAFVEILKEFSPCVEQCSIDEAYCDMSGTLGLYGSAIEAANLIKDKIYQKLGFTVNVGISSNKVLAKMASDFKKPNLVHTLFPDEIERKLWKLPVEELFYVGRATKKKLNELGIRTIGELAKTDLNILRSHFKKYADVIHSFANGIDISMVSEESSPNKGYGNSTTTSFDVDKEDAAKMVLLSLCEKTAARLRADAVKATVVAVELVNFEFHRTTHQLTLLSATNTTNEIHRASCRLFDELWDGTPIRKLGVHTSKVVCNESSSQLNLFDMNRNEKLSRLDTAVDEVRERFGKNAIFRASFLNNSVPPASKVSEPK